MSEAEFHRRARGALADAGLQAALSRARGGFVDARRGAIERKGRFDALSARARDAKERALSGLDRLLPEYERALSRNGGQLHWAQDAEAARRRVIDICRRAGVRRALKSKSMACEECDLNAALQRAKIEVRETDLGEYILQLAGERPSHIVAPALHKSRAQVAALFDARAPRRPQRPASADGIPELVADARAALRRDFRDADAIVTGANMLVAESGAAVLVTNEGNADLGAALARVHVVVAGIDKLVARWADVNDVLRVLAPSATGQDITAYTSFFFGPRGPGERSGADAFHVVLLDNQRSAALGGPYRDILRCIRCGACMNHCPVYQATGGHAYDSVYPGPLGAVLKPLLEPQRPDYELANASSFCGRCEAVCPVGIPLPGLMRRLRAEQRAEQRASGFGRWALGAWMALSRRPALYRLATGWALSLLVVARRRGRLRRLPGLSAWTRTRDLPAPARASFQRQWRRKRRRRAA